MQQLLLLILIGVAGCSETDSTAATAQNTKAAETPDVVPNAAGVCLAEVVAMTKYDHTGADGNAGLRASLRIVRSSGLFQESIDIVTKYGGLGPPGSEYPKTFPGPVRPDSISVGKRYWFAFSSRNQWDKHPQGVIAFWQEWDATVKNQLDEAIKNDRYGWSPQFEPTSGLTYGHKVDEKKKEWSIRVERNRKMLWETTLSGKRSGRWRAWTVESQGNMLEIPETIRNGGAMGLLAETELTLADGNEYELPGGDYFVQHFFDLENGQRLATVVSKAMKYGDNPLAFQAYDRTSGKKVYDRRDQVLETGGKALGGREEQWWRRTVRRFDAKTGNVASEEVFRYVTIIESPGVTRSGWLKIEQMK